MTNAAAQSRRQWLDLVRAADGGYPDGYSPERVERDADNPAVDTVVDFAFR